MIYRTRLEAAREVIATNERNGTFWTGKPGGRRILENVGLQGWILNVRTDCEEERGGEYFITLCLSSLAFFRSYLHNMGKEDSPDCMYCQGTT